MRSAMSIRRTRTLRTTALTATALAATLLLTACQGEETDASSGASSSSAAKTPAKGGSAASAGGTTGGADGADSTDDADSTDGADGATAGKDASSSTRSSRCRTADLAMDFVPAKGDTDTGDAGQRTAIVLVHNESKRTYTLQGFPGVDLKNSLDSWSLARSSETEAKTTIEAGDSTQFTIRFLPYTKEATGPRFEPDNIVITPPNATTSITVEWPWTAVLRQDGATRPGTFVGPIGS